jgi:uncharacterized protein YrrD
MSTSTRIDSKTLVGNAVIGIKSGKMIGEVADIRLDPDTLKVTAAVTSKGTLLKREVELIPADQVQVWGPDAVLVKELDVIVKEEELGDHDDWLSVTDDVQGYEVVSEDGTRIGTLGDLVLNHQGEVMGYEMAEVAAEGRVAVSDWIDVKATRSLGPDVLIVKSEFV